MSYREAGEGNEFKMLMIHGNFACSVYFEYYMKHLSPHFHCIAPCLRGFGFSSYNKKIKK